MEFNKNKSRRLLLGIAILLVVDIIWVGSSELSEYIFKDVGYDKPYFSTYLKTSLFSLYLLGFLCFRPWRHQCLLQDHSTYQVVDASPEEDSLSQETSSLGEPTYEPLKVAEHEKSSDAESDDLSVRSVRFSKMAEVRRMSESEAMEAMLSRLSFTASLKAQQRAMDVANKFPVHKVMKISFIFCVPWFFGNYGYQVALSDTEAGVVNVISSTCGLFTLILAAIFPSSTLDRFSVSKLGATLLMVVGTSMISVEDIKIEQKTVPLGVMWAVLGAILYACYMVFLKRKVPDESKMDFSMFFGFVGFFNMLILWPGFLIIHAIGWEPFQPPTSYQLLAMVLNGLVGTVFSELLWIWGCFLTSSLMATLSLSLTIPMTMAFDIAIKGIHYSWRFYVGSLPIFLAFIAVSFLTHYEDRDPLLDLLVYIGRFCLGRRKEYRLVSLDSQEQESLIVGSQDSTYEEANLEEDMSTSYQNHVSTLGDNANLHVVISSRLVSPS